MLGADMPIFQMTAFFAGVKENAFGFGCKVQLGGLRNAVPKDDSLFDLTADGIDGRCTAARKIPRCNSLILTHQA